jgi:uncharacterized protein (DUF305 family)
MLKSLLALLFLASIPALAQHSHEPANARAVQRSSDPQYSRFRREMDAGMGTMMKDMHAPGYSGNPDVDFLAMMIAHHQGAVEMARLELVHGRDPATRRLAEDIIATQTVEIDGMKRRLTALRTSRAGGAEEYPALGGTRGPAGN